MTLAIGMQCEGGIILAADTRLSYDGDPIQDGRKLTGCVSQTGTFTIVHSSEDANAATSLMSEIKSQLETSDPKTSKKIEDVVKSVLRKWYVPKVENRPSMQLLLGASVNDEKDAALYLCEPPNTVSRIWERYKGIGAGWTISDPLYEWFKSDSLPTPHSCLCQISYMMHRAKTQIPRSVGGNTDVAFLTKPATVPFWIERKDMESAEKTFGIMLDRSIAKFALTVVSGDAGGMQTILKTAEHLYQSALNYSRLEFRCQFPDQTIRRQFNT